MLLLFEMCAFSCNNKMERLQAFSSYFRVITTCVLFQVSIVSSQSFLAYSSFFCFFTDIVFLQIFNNASKSLYCIDLHVPW